MNFLTKILDIYGQNKFQTFKDKVEDLYLSNTTSPIKELLFDAFNFDFSKLKVIILGQDPYLNNNVADGLAFSTRNNSLPKSLSNIFKELFFEYQIKPDIYSLRNWRDQGVLLMNSILTVDSISLSHQKIGWQEFIIDVIEYININCPYLVVILWGNIAKSFQKYFNSNYDFITGCHPCQRFNTKFIGGNYFIDCNNYLTKHNIDPIDWTSGLINHSLGN